MNARKARARRVTHSLFLLSVVLVGTAMARYEWHAAAAVITALAAAHARLLIRHEALRTRAVRDPLTGLFNRHYLDTVLVRELHRSARNEGHVGLILIDIDHFKSYNDTWGHAAGDALLQQFARLMQRVVRESDIVCRFGGEEFVIVLPDASWELVRASAETLRAESSRLHVRLNEQILDGITVSAGIAISPGHGMTVEGLLASADRALYAAKSSGRDRIAIPPHQIVAA